MTYIMDTTDEGRRVERKTDRTLTIQQLRWAGVNAAMRVLDLGCAAGTTCRLIAGIVGISGRVIGVDASQPRLLEGKAHPGHRPIIEYRCGGATRIPAASGEFDVAWSRFLFEYLPRPEAAFAEMIRVTKTGGTVCVSDIDGNCTWHYPCDPDLHAEIDTALRTLGDGFNPRMGLQLYTMFIDAGLQDVCVDIRPYHVIAGSIDSEREDHWRMKLAGVSNALQVRGWTKNRTSAFVDAFLAHLRDRRSLTYSILVTIRGRVPPYE